MSGGASPLLGVVLIGGAFGGAFLLLLFMLWASGRSPLVRVTGEVVAALFYLVMALAQAWLTRGTDDGILWKAVSVALALGAAFNTFRFSKIYCQQAGASAPDEMAQP